MNFLFHLFLSGDDPEILVGNLMGDFVRGRLKGYYPVRIEEGIALHRRIDSFANGNRHFLRTKRRIDPSFGLYRGILADVFHDHFLAARWEDHGGIPFPLFLSKARQALRQHEEILPDRLRRILSMMFEEWLPSYHRIDGVAAALFRMSFRVKRTNPLAIGAMELTRHYQDFYDDFLGLLPELIECCRSFPLTRVPKSFPLTRVPKSFPLTRVPKSFPLTRVAKSSRVGDKIFLLPSGSENLRRNGNE